MRIETNTALSSASSQGGTSLVVVALVADVWLGVGAWETWSSAEMLLGFSVLGSSKEESVGAYYNILIRIEETSIDIHTSGCEEHKLV
jgi:hypothetical protein